VSDDVTTTNAGTPRIGGLRVSILETLAEIIDEAPSTHVVYKTKRYALDSEDAPDGAKDLIKKYVLARIKEA